MRIYLLASCVLAWTLAVSTRAGQSLYFGDPGGTVEISATVLPAERTQLTLECRVKLLAPITDAVRVVSQWCELAEKKKDVLYNSPPRVREQTDRGSFCLGFTRAGQIAVGFRTMQGNEHTLTSTGFKPDGQWHYLVATWSRGTAVLYIDGKKVGMQAFPNDALAASKLPLVIGQEKKDGESAVEGFITDVAIWNSVREASSITQSANGCITGSEPGLICFFSLNAEAPASKVSGLPRGIPDGQLTGALPKVGWCETPRWQDPKSNPPWFHVSRYDLSVVPKPLNDEDKEALPAINSGNRRLVINDKTQQAGVVWQDPGTKRVYVTWLNSDFTGLRCAALPVLEKGELMGATWGAGGNLYYFMIQPLAGNHAETQVPKGQMRMASANGQSVQETPVDLGPGALNWYTGWGRCNMAFANDTLSLIMPRIMCNGNPTGEGVHHQASVTANFSADLKVLKNFGNPASHSCGTILAATSSNDAMGLELGDCFPRALQLHKFTKDRRASKIIFNYKANLITIEKDGRPLKVSHDANTYTELGGVAEGTASYSVIIATDRSPAGLVLDYSRVGKDSEPRNLAMLRVAKNFDSIAGGYDVNDKLMIPGTPVATPPETGEFHVFTGEQCRQRNPGVVWLTDYGPGEAAHAPHIIRRRDGGILILWEKTGGGENALWAMVVHESGRALIEPVRIAANVELDREDPIARIGNRDCVLAYDHKCNKLFLYCILETAECDKQPWAGSAGWGPENPVYPVERRKSISAALRARLDSINAVTDRIDKWELLAAYLSEELLSAADPALAKDAQTAFNELLKDPAIRKEQDAAVKYQAIADMEQQANKDRNKNRKKETLLIVAAAVRDLSNSFKGTRAGKKAAADFERLKKDSQ